MKRGLRRLVPPKYCCREVELNDHLLCHGFGGGESILAISLA